MELSDLQVPLARVPLYVRKSLEDGFCPAHTISGGSSDQDGYERRLSSRSCLGLLSIVHPLKMFFTVHHGHIARSIWTQANRPVQRHCERGRRRGYSSLSLGPLRRLLSKRATATSARHYEPLRFIRHGVCWNRCQVHRLL